MTRDARFVDLPGSGLTERHIAMLRTNVARGAALLDEKKPDWWRNIDQEVLNITSASCCILGQVYGNFEQGMVETGLTDEDRNGLVGGTLDTAYGFNLAMFDDVRPAPRKPEQYLSARTLQLHTEAYIIEQAWADAIEARATVAKAVAPATSGGLTCEN